MPQPADYNELAYSLAGVKRKNPFDAKRTFAQRLQTMGADTSPVDHPLQGAARLAQALVGGWMGGQADRDEAKAGIDHENKIKEASSIADPAERMAALSALGGDAGLRATIASTGQELAKKRQRDDDLQASSFLLGGGSGPQQAGGGGAAVAPEQAQAAAKQKIDYLVSNHNLTPEQASIMVGNLYQESGFNPTATHDGGTGYGLGGWRLERRDALMKAAQAQGRNPADPQFQLDFYANEFKGRPEFQKFQQAQTPQERQTAMMDYFRPAGWTPNNPQGGHGFNNRLQYGQQFQGGPQQAVLRGPPGSPTPIGTYTPGTARAELAQGSADGSGTPNPTQSYDAGGQYEEAARRAHAAGRGDIAIKYMQQATAAREAAAKSADSRTLQHVDLGDSVGILDPRTGSIVQRIPKGTKPGAGEGGAFGGTGMENQARSALVKAAQDPRFAGSPEYAAAHSYLSRPRFDPGSQTTLPPEDLTRFPAPTYSAQGQPQAQPPQQAAAQPPGAPPAPSPSVVGGPAVVAQPPGGIVATPVQGMPAKPMTGEQALAAGFTDRMANSNSLLAGLDGQGLSAWGSLNEKIPMAGNYRQTPEYRQYKQARDDFINAQLRRESGAAISDAEYDRANKQYFPQPGDDAGTIAQKAKNRALVVDAMRRNAGPGYTQNPAVGGAPSKSGADLKKKWNLE